MTGPGEVLVEEVPEPVAEEGEVLVDMTSWGLCAGDVAAFKGTNVAIRFPLTLGHEGVGIVRHGATEIEPGTYVMVVPSLTCGQCTACQSGHENHCTKLVVMGVGNPNGLFRNTVSVPASQLIAVSHEVGAIQGALIEPLAIAAHITGRTDVTHRDIAIIGTGVCGITSGIIASGLCAKVTMVDIVMDKARIAAKVGLTDFVLNEGDLQSQLLEGRKGFDIVIDTVGTKEVTDVAITVLRPGGVLVTVAAAAPGRPLVVDYATMYRKELSIIGTRNYTRADFHHAIALLDSGEIDLRPIVTARLPLTRALDGLLMLTEHPEDHVKILLESDI